MIDLRNYKDLIRELVAKENDKDKNWRWSVKSISKNRVRIRWGYLDYLEEKENCFQIELDSSMERDRKSTRLNPSHANESRMPSSA